MKNKKKTTKIDIHSIKDPSFLNDLNYKQLDNLSTDIADYIVDATSINGGHLSSNLGVVDATIALCRSFDFSKDKIIFDVGHQSYTYKILTGRSLDRLRQKDGVCGFQRMDESPYDHFEAGHSSTSIAVANGMAIARDLKNEKYNIIAFIGDSSVANGLSFEALNDVAMQKHKIIIVLNDNDMSISHPVGGLSKLFRRYGTSWIYEKTKAFFKILLGWNKLGRWIYQLGSNFKNWIKFHILRTNIFDNLGYSYIGPVNGHDIKALEKAFKKAKYINKSVLVHIKTIKGKGYGPAENDKEGNWHGVAPFDKQTGMPLNKPKFNWSEFYSDMLLKLMKENKKIVALVPGTGVGSYINKIHQEFPKRTIDVGIAEEYALTMAGGLSASGFHPVISIYSTFLQRAYDEISHDIARPNLNATLLIDRAGLVGSDGTSHQGIYDEAFLMSIPNTVIAMASNPGQSYSLLKESLNNHGVFAIRYPKYDCQEIINYEDVAFGKWKKELVGEKIAIIGVGPEVEELKEKLKDKNVTLINAIYQKPIDLNCLDELLNYEKIIIYDAYSVIWGFPQVVSSSLMEKGFKGEVILKAIPDTFVKHASVKQQKEQYGLLVEDIVDLI